MRLLVFSRDPGGANTVIPVIEKLKAGHHDVIVYGKDTALKKYNERNISAIDIELALNEITVNALAKFLKLNNISCVLTGTSADDMTEKYLWKASELCGIKSYAILDQWINYGIRFSEYGVSNISSYLKNPIHKYLPTHIMVMDDYAKKRMINCGFEEKRLIVTGQPHFDYLNKKHQKSKNRENQTFEVVFASEPIVKTYGSSEHWGYDEKSICYDIIDVLRVIAHDNGIRIHLLIKQHPKEESHSYDSQVGENGLLKISVDRNSNSFDVIMSSDLIIGMSSMFLIEGVIMNKQVISYQKGLKQDNPYVFDKINTDNTLFNKKDLLETIKGIINGEKKIYNFSLIQNATNNVIKHLEV